MRKELSDLFLKMHEMIKCHVCVDCRSFVSFPPCLILFTFFFDFHVLFLLLSLLMKMLLMLLSLVMTILMLCCSYLLFIFDLSNLFFFSHSRRHFVFTYFCIKWLCMRGRDGDGCLCGGVMLNSVMCMERVDWFMF